MTTLEILKTASDRRVSYLYLVPGHALSCQIRGEYENLEDEVLTPTRIMETLKDIYDIAGRKERLNKIDSDDFSFAIPGKGRFRINIYKQRGTYAAVIQVIQFLTPTPEDNHIPSEVMKLADVQKGLVLICGEAGSGRATTRACLIDNINHKKNGHIVSIEDPIKFVHKHDKSLISQREILIDTPNYGTGLHDAMREAPSVIMLDKLSDEYLEPILNAAEMGILVISSLYTTSVSETLIRLIDNRLPSEREQFAGRLSQVLKGVVCQKLVRTNDGNILPVFDLMVATPIVKDMVRKGRISNIESVMNEDVSMLSMDKQLLELYKAKKISKDEVLNNCVHYEILSHKLR